MKAYSIFIIPLLTIYGFFLQKTDNNTTQQTKHVYVILNRNSPNFEFTDHSRVNKQNNEREENLQYSFIHEDCEELHFVHVESPYLERFDKKFKAPITFLDTIIFHNERYLLENFDSLTRNELNSLARKGKEAYVIDMGTLCNDSLMVYQTEIRMSGCRE